VLDSQRLTFALGQNSGRVQAGQEHDGPQEGADHGPQEAFAQIGAPFVSVDLVWALTEKVFERKCRETEYSAKQEKQIDVDVHDNLLMKNVGAAQIGGLPDLKSVCPTNVMIV
jgi:hypothetical protein